MQVDSSAPLLAVQLCLEVEEECRSIAEEDGLSKGSAGQASLERATKELYGWAGSGRDMAENWTGLCWDWTEAEVLIEVCDEDGAGVDEEDAWLKVEAKPLLADQARCKLAGRVKTLLVAARPLL